jgi:hypothetical protein
MSHVQFGRIAETLRTRKRRCDGRPTDHWTGLARGRGGRRIFNGDRRGDGLTLGEPGVGAGLAAPGVVDAAAPGAVGCSDAEDRGVAERVATEVPDVEPSPGRTPPEGWHPTSTTSPSARAPAAAQAVSGQRGGGRLPKGRLPAGTPTMADLRASTALPWTRREPAGFLAGTPPTRSAADDARSPTDRATPAEVRPASRVVVVLREQPREEDYNPRSRGRPRSAARYSSTNRGCVPGCPQQRRAPGRCGRSSRGRLAS